MGAGLWAPGFVSNARVLIYLQLMVRPNFLQVVARLSSIVVRSAQLSARMTMLLAYSTSASPIMTWSQNITISIGVVCPSSMGHRSWLVREVSRIHLGDMFLGHPLDPPLPHMFHLWATCFQSTVTVIVITTFSIKSIVAGLQEWVIVSSNTC